MMLNVFRILGHLALAWAFAGGAQAENVACPDSASVAVQVLGSGGPIADDARASAGYLVWIDGASRILIDAGGGAFLRFGEAGARFTDLDFIGLSHFHTDHSADLPALLKSGYFSGRSQPLTIAGPSGAGPFPGLNAFLGSMLDDEQGAYGYLSGYLDGSGGMARLDPVEVPAQGVNAVQANVARADRFAVDAMPVPHGPVPALAFRLRVSDLTLVFSSDQNGSDPAFADFARDADLLVMHMPIPENADATARRLHASPAAIGAIAETAGAKTLLLSHLMARSLANLDENVGRVRAAYGGKVAVADDLTCVKLKD